MKESLDQESIDIVTEFVKNCFPKKRVRLSPKNKNFKRVIEIPATLNNGTRYLYALSDKNNLGLLFMRLYDILKNVFFGFDIELLNHVLYQHLGIQDD